MIVAIAFLAGILAGYFLAVLIEDIEIVLTTAKKEQDVADEKGIEKYRGVVGSKRQSSK